MIKRILDVSEPAYLSLRNGQLLIDKKISEEWIRKASIPVEDIGILILQNPGIVITQAALLACQKNNAVVMFCDKHHMPYSLLLPIVDGHSLHTRILRDQIGIKRVIRKKIWKQIVREKIKSQAHALDLCGKSHMRISRMIHKVKSADKENHEAQAAQIYWPLLFGKEFKRDPNVAGVNALLNYGYAVVRAMIARSIVATGLHPALGIHHVNQYNSFCLVDDIMEPIRPWVDWEVYKMYRDQKNLHVCRETKEPLLALLVRTVTWEHMQMPLFNASHHMAMCFKRIIMGESDKMIYPKKLKHEDR